MTLTLPSPSESTGRDRLRSVLHTPFTLPAVAVVACGMLALLGFGNLTEAARTFPFEVPAIYIALEIFSALVIGTGIGDALAVRLANRSAGRPIATMALSVTLLMATCALGNNLTHVGLILPILLALLSTMILSRGFILGYLSLIMAIVNLAGASTPVGDFPALTIMASGITTFTDYLILAFPLFGVLTPAALLLFYVHRLRGQRPRLQVDAPPAETGAVLLAAKHARLKVDRATLARLLFVLAGMFAGWVALPQIPAWAVAWAGAAIAVLAAPRARHTVHIGMTDLEPVLKIGTFLGVASYVATTGVLELIASALQAISQPQLLLVAMMIAVALITSVVSAGPTAAVLLPVAQTLVLPGAALAGHGDLVAIAFAGAICAGSSVFLISATAGPLIARRVQSFGLTDDHGRPVVFGARQYLPFGFLNGLIQLTVAVTAVLTLYTLIGA